MKRRNVWRDVKRPLERHADSRGCIADIFYKAPIRHVAIISSGPGALRGDHYHKKTVQHMLITRGALEYWHKPLRSRKPARCEFLRTGDLVTTPPLEVHALRIVEDNEFVVFSEGQRGGRDYESDTFRVSPSIIPASPTGHAKRQAPVRLHLGCGKRYLPGYTHIDIDEHPHLDYCHDIKSLPMFNDATVNEIYTCGTFEYLDRVTEVPDALAEWRRVLRPGGLLRISVPDLAAVVKVYRKYKNVDGIGVLGPLYGRIDIATEAGPRVLFHKTVYDFASLRATLQAAGFREVKRYDWRTVLPAGYDDFSAAYVPHMDSSGIPMSLNVVCRRDG